MLEQAYRIVDNAKLEKLYFLPVRTSRQKTVVFTEARRRALLECLDRTDDRNVLNKRDFERLLCDDRLEFDDISKKIASRLGERSKVCLIDTKNHLRSVQIETLLRCNLTCGYCYCGADKERTEILSFDEICRVIDDCDRLGVLVIDFTGGEFTLHPKWRELVSYARSLSLGVTIHTNGTSLNEKNVDFLKAMGIREVQISIDGSTPELHNAIRGHHKAFQKTMHGVRLLKSRKIPVTFAVGVHRNNIDDLSEIVYSLGATSERYKVAWISPFGSEIQSKTGVSAAEFYKATKALWGNRDVVIASKPCGREMGWLREDYEPSCGVGQSYAFVTATGELAICPQLTSREDPVEFGGPNIRDQSLFDAWTVGDYFERHRYVNCVNVETCVAGTACRGGCRANAYAQSGGNYRSPEIIECNRHKNSSDSFVDFFDRYAHGQFGVVSGDASIGQDLA